MASKQPVVLLIRDGWGINPSGADQAEADGNAVELADTPFHDALFAKYPSSRIRTSGEDVGLPDGQMGNSEVGHLNLGAGRIVYQDLTRINKAIAEDRLGEIEALISAFAKAKGKRLHLVGLLSDGGVHSHQDQLVALANAAKKGGVEDIWVHAITDGRDTSPTGGQAYLAETEAKLVESGATIATVVGRYYAMDRDKRWERTKLGWDAIVHGIGEASSASPSEAVAASYESGTTDEFLLPLTFAEPDTQRVRDGDVVLFFNFRADRARQLSIAFLEKEFAGFDRGAWPQVHYVTLTEYDETYECEVVFPPEILDDVLGQVVAKAGLSQLRMAETEKYPHVSYFFNGGLEEACQAEQRLMVNSPKVATYDLQPEMSASELTDKFLENVAAYDLVILNFANPDMVGHTGSVEAAVKAVETVDYCCKRIVEKVLGLNGHVLLTADHGNCEFMRKADGSPHTAHTTFPVHLIYASQEATTATLKDGILADIAPTILDLLGLDKPLAMTGESLVERG